MALVLFLCPLGWGEAEEENSEETASVAVLTHKVTDDVARAVRRYPARVRAIEQVDVVTRLSADIEEVGFTEGTEVAVGQLLYRLDDVRYRAAVSNQHAKVSEVAARLKLSEQTLARKAALSAKGMAPQAGYDAAVADQASLAAQLAAEQAALALAEDDLNHTRIVAPIAGRIGLTSKTIGNYVTPESGVLTRIVRTDPLRIRFSLSLTDYARFFAGDAKRLKKEAEVSVLTATGLPSLPKGTIEFVDVSAVERTDKVMEEFLASIRDIPAIETIMLESGSSMMSGMGENFGTAFIQLKDWSERPDPEDSQDAVLEEVQRRADLIPEARISCMATSPLMDLGTSDGLELQFCSEKGATGPQLAGALSRFAAVVRRLPGAGAVTLSFNSDTPQINLDVDRDKAQSLGVSVDGLFTSLQSLLSAHYVNDFSHNGNNYHVIVQANNRFRASPEALGEIQISNDRGEFVPLGAFCTFRKVPGVRQINRFNKQTSVSMTVAVASGGAAELMRGIEETVRDFPDYHVEWTGVAREQRANEGRLFSLLLLACFFAYLFLVAQYESWTLPISILLTVLFALFGGYLALALAGLTLSVYAQLGLVMLIGLAAKNAILMVEFSRKKRLEGASVEASALEGSRTRYRAVLMTAWSFIVGVLPLVFATGAGCASRQSIGLITLGGMLMATIVGISFPSAYFALIERMAKRGNDHY